MSRAGVRAWCLMLGRCPGVSVDETSLSSNLPFSVFPGREYPIRWNFHVRLV